MSRLCREIRAVFRKKVFNIRNNVLNIFKKYGKSISRLVYLKYSL